MTKTASILCCLCMALAAVGCISPETTRMPSLFRGQLSSEHASSQRVGYEINDPLPEEDLGPFTDTRPRSYNIPRAEPRRAKENYYAPELQGSPNNGAMARPTTPTAEFPGTVDSQ